MELDIVRKGADRAFRQCAAHLFSKLKDDPSVGALLLTPCQFLRALNVLVEESKGDPELIYTESDRYRIHRGVGPEEKFTVLLSNFGRAGLRRQLMNVFPKLCQSGWMGFERRSRWAARADRTPPDPNPTAERFYDHLDWLAVRSPRIAEV